jgi:hypothetical protein
MFLLPPPEDVSCDGSSDEQPLFLHGVRKAAFRRLLMAMEQWKFLGERMNDLTQETARILFQEWASVLELSCMWQMAKVRERADQEISKLSLSSRPKGLDISVDTVRTSWGSREIRDIFIRMPLRRSRTCQTDPAWYRVANVFVVTQRIRRAGYAGKAVSRLNMKSYWG